MPVAYSARLLGVGSIVLALAACGGGGSEDAGVARPDAAASADSGSVADGAGLLDAAADAGSVDSGPPPAIHVRVEAALLSDDDGRRPAAISTASVAAWLAYATRAFAPAGVVFDFDPAADVARVRSTLLNSAAGTDEPRWADVVREGNALAAAHAGKLLVVFRHGPDAAASGAGFSWTDYDFVVAPGFATTVVCGRQNIELLGHEIGHQLGLAHTFAGVFADLREAEAALAAGGGAPEVFDGDGLEDTAPDPFITALQCGRSSTVSLGGQAFAIPRENLMGYWAHGAKTLSPSQAAIVRQGALLRTGQPMPAGVPAGVDAAFEEGEMDLAATTGGVASVQDMRGFLGRWSGGAHLFWARAVPGERLTRSFEVPDRGDYDVYVGLTRAPDYGVFEHTLDGRPLGPAIDLYARSVQPTGPLLLGRARLNTGRHVLGATVSGRNPRAVPDRFFYGLDYILAVRRS